MRVVGVDLSLTATGIATPEDTRTVVTVPEQGDDARMAEIAGIVKAVAWSGEGPLSLVVLEGGSSHGVTAFRLGGLHYVVRNTLFRNRIPFAVVSPATLKKFATGHASYKDTVTGRMIHTAKPDMRMALYKRTGIDEPNDNLVDAWWLYYAGLFHLGHRPFTLPAAQIDALAKAEWPLPPDEDLAGETGIDPEART